MDARDVRGGSVRSCSSAANGKISISSDSAVELE